MKTKPMGLVWLEAGFSDVGGAARAGWVAKGTRAPVDVRLASGETPDARGGEFARASPIACPGAGPSALSRQPRT